MLERLDYAKNERIREAWEKLLETTGLRTDPPYTAVYGIYKDGQLVATGARDGARIKCIAIRDDYRGGTVFHELLSGMITEALDDGVERLFLYTTPDAVQSFTHLGFRLLAQIDNGISFMERGAPTIDDYIGLLKEQRINYDKDHGAVSGPVESIVMNANPFTKGQRALVRMHFQDLNAFISLFSARMSRLSRRKHASIWSWTEQPISGGLSTTRLIPTSSRAHISPPIF